METGSRPGARDGKARVRLPIGSTDAQGSPAAHAQWLRGEVAAKPGRWGFRPGPLGTELGLAGPGSSRILPGREAVQLSSCCGSGSSPPRRRPHSAAIVARAAPTGPERQVLMSERQSPREAGPGRGWEGEEAGGLAGASPQGRTGDELGWELEPRTRACGFVLSPRRDTWEVGVGDRAFDLYSRRLPRRPPNRAQRACLPCCQSAAGLRRTDK